mgnify:CR=1 FL=1
MLTTETGILPVKEEAIPDAMQAAPRWVCWQAVEKTKSDGTTYLTFTGSLKDAASAWNGWW